MLKPTVSIACMKAHSVVYNNHCSVCCVIIWWLFTKQCGPVGGTVVSYLGGSGFKARSGDRMPWLGFFEVTAKVIHQIRSWPFSTISISTYCLLLYLCGYCINRYWTHQGISHKINYVKFSLVKSTNFSKL